MIAILWHSGGPSAPTAPQVACPIAMSFTPYRAAPRKSKPQRTAEALDVAARYFLYKLYDATNRQPGAWQVLGNMIGERKETVKRAVGRGRVVARDEAVGKGKGSSACLRNRDNGWRIRVFAGEATAWLAVRSVSRALSYCATACGLRILPRNRGEGR